MGKYSIDILDVLKLAFGQHVNAYVPYRKTKKVKQKKYPTIDIDLSDDYGEGDGLLGLPIFQSTIFTDIEEPQGKTYNLYDSLVDIQATKNIVKTPVVGLDYTVKEFISNGDWDITIKGLLINQEHPDRLPEIQIREFVRWFKKGRKLGVEGKLFEYYGITDIVIEGVNMPQIPGYIAMRPFELKCISDTEYVIDLDNNV